MKPVSFKPMHSSNFIAGNQSSYFGADNTVRKIAGTVLKQSIDYANALVVIFRKSDFQPIAVRKPDISGHYAVLGMNGNLTCFVVGFDLSGQFNAVIQDRVIPK